MAARIIPFALLLFIVSCTSKQPEIATADSTMAAEVAETPSMDNNQEIEIVKDEKAQPMVIDTAMEAYVAILGLSETYNVSTNHEPYILHGYFNDDSFMDTVIIVRDKKSYKEGLLIKHGNTPEYIVLGAGEEVLEQNFDDFNWIGVFDKIKKGEKIASNIDEETGEIATEDIPDSLKTELKNEGIYVHMAESCGGGIIYWDNKKYNWIQQE